MKIAQTRALSARATRLFRSWVRAHGFAERQIDVSIAAGDAVDLDRVGDDESHPEIKLDGVLIRRGDMEPGEDAFTAVFSREAPDEARGKSLAAMRRVSANATDLGVAVEDHSLATHRDEFAAGADAEVGAHLAGSYAEEAGKCEVGQGDHLVGVCAGEWNDVERRSGKGYVIGQDHLEAFEHLVAGEVSGGAVFSDEPDLFSRSQERVKRLERGDAG